MWSNVSCFLFLVSKETTRYNAESTPPKLRFSDQKSDDHYTTAISRVPPLLSEGSHSYKKAKGLLLVKGNFLCHFGSDFLRRF